MRIAVLLRGLSRSFNEVSHLYCEKLPKDADIFIDTYEEPYQEKHRCHYVVSRELFKNVFGEKLKGFQSEKLSEVLAEGRGFLEENKVPLFNHRFRQCNINASWAQLRKISSSIRMKKAYEEEHGFVYDVVIVMRMDLNLRSDFSLPGMKSLETKLFHPAGEGFTGEKRNLGAARVIKTNRVFNDQILVSSSKHVDSLIDIEKRIGYHSRKNVEINPETLIAFDIWNSKLEYESFDLIVYSIQR